MMSDVVAELARLSSFSSVPMLVRDPTPDIDMSPEEAYVASLLDSGMDVATLLSLSPLPEDTTLHFLARLVALGLVTVASAE